jgi:hypothetical protein
MTWIISPVSTVLPQGQRDLASSQPTTSSCSSEWAKLLDPPILLLLLTADAKSGATDLCTFLTSHPKTTQVIDELAAASWNANLQQPDWHIQNWPSQLLIFVLRQTTLTALSPFTEYDNHKQSRENLPASRDTEVFESNAYI